MADEEEPILDRTELAKALRRSTTYVSRMIRGGYKMKFRKTTTLAHALAWHEANPDFRTSDFYHTPKTPKRLRRAPLAAY